MGAANIVPHMLAPQEITTETPERVVGNNTKLAMKSASVMENSQSAPIEGEVQSGSVKPPHRHGPIEDKKPELDRTPLKGEQLEKLYELTKLVEGTAHWTEKQQEGAKKVMEEYSFLFAMGSLDLGCTNLVKHHIELTDYTPIKDRYRQIPPHQYEEVRKHLKEMLDVGAIRCSNSPWASPVVLI